MKTVIGVRLRRPGKIYYFNPGDKKINKGEYVIVETTFGQEYAEVVMANKEIEEKKIVSPLKDIVRVATKKDKEQHEQNLKKEKEAFDIAQENIRKHKLSMNLVDVQYQFDNIKILFYFTAEGRIDFRDLVKDLAAIFRTRIELRQIGLRDEVRRIGGNGICGRQLCCCSYLGDFDMVSIKMAKEQGLSLTPSKISGCCGRLMCCLKYEENVYEEKNKKLPGVGATVKTEDGEGIVEGLENLKEIVKVKLVDKDNNTFHKKYNIDEIKIIKDVEKDSTNYEADEELKRLEKLDKIEMQNNQD